MQEQGATGSAPMPPPESEGAGANWPWAAVVAVVSAVAAVATAGTAIYTVYQQNAYHRELIREQRELIQVQVSLDLVKQFDSSELRDARRGFAKELLSKKPGSGLVEHRVLEFFETLALYSAQRRVDVETVYSNFSYYVKYYWAASAPHILAFRSREGDEELYLGYQDLQDGLAADESRNRGIPRSEVQPRPENIRKFLRDEAYLPK